MNVRTIIGCTGQYGAGVLVGIGLFHLYQHTGVSPTLFISSGAFAFALFTKIKYLNNKKGD